MISSHQGNCECHHRNGDIGDKGKTKVFNYLNDWNSCSLERRYRMLISLIDKAEQTELMLSSPDETDKLISEGSGSFLERVLNLQYGHWLPDDILMKQDKMSMANSLEGRVPFLDHELVEFLLAMPPHLKLKGLTEKYILREFSHKILPTRLREETEYRPKPMVEIGGQPILWHIMKIYAHYNYATMQSDFTVEIGKRNDIQFHNDQAEEGWKVTLAETGLNAMTGARVKRIEKHIGDETFMLTYGDGVADINILDLLAFHHQHGKIGTITGVRPPSRFGELFAEGRRVVKFAEKPQAYGGLINGGSLFSISACLNILRMM